MSIASVVLADAPLHFWELQEASGTSAADATAGTPNNGTYNNVTLAAAGPQNAIPDKAASFNGTSSYIDVPHASDLNITGNLTLELWVRPTALNQDHQYISKFGPSNAEVPYSFFQYNADQFVYFGQATGGAWASTPMATRLIAGIWNHIAVKRVGSTITFYLNGAVDVVRTLSSTPGTNTSPVTIGSVTAHNGSWMNGRLAYVAMWNSGLSDAQILAHYNEAVANAISDMRVSQVAVEAAQSGVPSAMQLSQVAAEAAEYSTPSDMRLTQVAVEVLYNPIPANSGYKLLPTIM